MWVQFIAPLVAAIFIALTIKQRHPIVNFFINIREKILPKNTLKYINIDEAKTDSVPIAKPDIETNISEPIRDIDERPLSHIESSTSAQSFDLSSHISRLNERALNTSLEPLAIELDETLEISRLMSEFEMGRYLLQNRGFNGYWTKYMVIDGPKLDPETFNEVERWILFRAPIILATQQRFLIFKEKVQSRLTDGLTLASIPCGLMDDLLSLDYSAVKNVKLVGIDIDEVSISHAQQNAFAKEVTQELEFYHRNAWNLGFESKYNVIMSNGLNVYEPDNEKVILLYAQFYKALTDNGILITSFLTPPTEWVISESDAIVQKSIFTDILQVTFLTFHTEEETRQQLEFVGFTVLEVIYDDKRIFPTIIAEKRANVVE